MTENYLLGNPTARRLYFDTVASLGTLCLTRTDGVNRDKIYENAAQAFLLCDERKFKLMRMSGVDEKYICGTASDFEKFRELCKLLPNCIGNPTYLLSHIELKMLWNCDLPINSDNCEQIWHTLNDQLAYSNITDRTLANRAGLEQIPCLYLASIATAEADSLAKLESTIRSKCLGCECVVDDLPKNFAAPNPYLVDVILKKQTLGEPVSEDDRDALNMQIRRIAATACREQGIKMLFSGGASLPILEYLRKNNITPDSADVIFFDIGDSMDTLGRAIREYMHSGILGITPICITSGGYARDVAGVDYLRRTVCTVLGDIFEHGEYLESYEKLADLAENVLYNNIHHLRKVTKI